MRQQRNNEAKELIGMRVGTAKAIFNQNSASGQMLLSINKSAPIKPIRKAIPTRNNLSDEIVTTSIIPEDEVANDVVENISVVTPVVAEVPSHNVQTVLQSVVVVIKKKNQTN